MLEINLKLYSILREKYPSGSGGWIKFQLKNGAVLDDLLKELDITRKVVISVNGVHERDTSRRLQNGDEVQIFSSVSGG